MDNKETLNIIHTIKKNFLDIYSLNTFNNLPSELIDLFNAYCSLLEIISIVKIKVTDEAVLDSLTEISSNLDRDLLRIVDSIGFITDRKVLVHKVSECDSIWKVSKKYNSDISEILKINNIKNIFSLGKSKIILIPIKI